MAKLLLPDEGLPDWVDQSLARNLWVGLLKTNLAADKNTTLADALAQESDYPGYGRVHINGAWWAPAVLVADVAKTISNHCDFNFGGGAMDGQDVFGYFVCNDGVTKLLLIQMKDPDPPSPIDLAHPTFTVIPGFGLFSQYTS